MRYDVRCACLPDVWRSGQLEVGSRRSWPSRWPVGGLAECWLTRQAQEFEDFVGDTRPTASRACDGLCGSKFFGRVVDVVTAVTVQQSARHPFSFSSRTTQHASISMLHKQHHTHTRRPASCYERCSYKQLNNIILLGSSAYNMCVCVCVFSA